jgi:ATP-dependent DNA ligase
VRSLDEWRRAEATALPTWVKPQLTKLVDQPPDGPDWLHEIKFDGYRMHARQDRGAVRLLTRTGLDWTHKYPPPSRRRYRRSRPSRPISTGSCAASGPTAPPPSI